MRVPPLVRRKDGRESWRYKCGYDFSFDPLVSLTNFSTPKFNSLHTSKIMKGFFYLLSALFSGLISVSAQPFIRPYPPSYPSFYPDSPSYPDPPSLNPIGACTYLASSARCSDHSSCTCLATTWCPYRLSYHFQQAF